jgi:hypothetical protein
VLEEHSGQQANESAGDLFTGRLAVRDVRLRIAVSLERLTYGP